MRKIKVAQIGVMHDHARDAIRALKSMTDVFELIVYAHPDSDDFDKKFYEDIQEMSAEEILSYPGLDAVVIETQEKDLTKYAIMAAQKGLHIHLDKPGGFEEEEFDRFIDMVKEKNLVLSMGYMYRFNPSIKKALEIVKSGKLGRIYSVEGQMSCYLPKEKREWLNNFPGGMMFYLGCHLTDVVLQCMGSFPDEIIPFNGAIKHEGTTSYDYSMAVYTYDTVASFIKTTMLEHGGFLRRHIVICGTEGTIEINPTEYHPILNERELASDMYVTYKDEQLKMGVDARGKRTQSETYDRYKEMLTKFKETVTGETENTYDLEYERNLYKTVLASCGK